MAAPRVRRAGQFAGHYIDSSNTSQRCLQSDLDTSHSDARLLPDAYILPLGDNDVPWSIKSNGLSRQHDGDFECNPIGNTDYPNDLFVVQSAFNSNLSLNPSSTQHHNATTYDHEMINLAASGEFEGFIEQPGSEEAMFESNCADTVHNFTPSMVDYSSCSDYERNRLRFDAAANHDTVEPYLLRYEDLASISYNELSEISTLDMLGPNASPDSHSSATKDGGPQTLANYAPIGKGENRQCHTSVCREWLDKNGLRSYPTPDQIAELAAIAGVTVKQARNALSNYRSRMQQKLTDKGLRQLRITLTPKRKGRRHHIPRSDQTHSTIISSSSQVTGESGIDAARTYHCTACPKSFRNAYSWKRHELGVHGYNDTEWVCMLHDFVAPGRECMFCHDHVVHMGHFDLHNIPDCLEKDVYERTFARKDLLKQHILQKHLVGTEESLSKAFQVPQAWEKEVDAINIKSEALWCGFCTCMCDSVADRMEHVAGHFRNGYDMDGWVHLSI